MSEAPYQSAEPPTDGDWAGQVPPPGAPRFSASASVPVPPVAPAGSAPPTSPFAPSGSSYGEPPVSPYGQVTTPGAGQQPSAPAAGHARASASVPSAPSAPGGYPSSAAPSSYGAPPQGFASAGGQGATYGQPASASQFGTAPSAMGQPAMGQSPMGQPPMGQSPMGQPPVGQPAGAPGQGAYGQHAFPQSTPQEPGQNKMVPTDGWPYVEPTAPAPKSRRGLIIAAFSVALLVVIGVGGYVGWSLTTHTSGYQVGKCVRQDGTGATVVGCTTTGSYKITSIVDGAAGCPDVNQPSLILTDGTGGQKYACLAPAAG